MFERIVSVINDIVWNPLLVVLLVGAGLYFSFRTRFVQVRRFGLMIRSLFAKAEVDEKGGRHGISSFEAFCIALSGRVGTGNIVGVATAIALGGPGAVFWMWIIAFFGASTAFVESTLAQVFKFHHSTGYRGGPSSYIEHGLGKPAIAILFSVLAIVGYGILLPTVQANGVAGALTNSFRLPSLAAGLGMAFLLALVIIGGVKSISRVASIITPFMALGYIIFSLFIIFQHIDAIPAVLKSIVDGAFGVKPVAGGILGSTIMMGVKRGIFSNEAGQGSGAMVSAAAAVSHPARQGLAQAFSVYVDTLLVCTATALMILCSGTYNILDAKTGEMLVANAPELEANYVGFTQAAVDSAFSGFGSAFVSIALVFFAFTTLMAYYFYTESSIIYLFSGRGGSQKTERALIWAYRFVLLVMVVFGSLREANVVWQLGDIGVGMTAWINVLSLLILCPHAIKALKEYEKEGENPK
ncbi:MAG: alanine:cation symporter family protein [Bacteroidales bacterium]|nr:alanine:cation symporter family protein [Bacteroidales bacterium]